MRQPRQGAALQDKTSILPTQWGGVRQSRTEGLGPSRLHRRAGSTKPHRGDLRQDAERGLFGSPAPQVQADGAVDTRELLFGEPFLAQRVEPVQVGLAAPD